MTARDDLPCPSAGRSEAYGFFASIAARPLTSEDLAAMRATVARADGGEGAGLAAELMADAALAPGGPDMQLALARDHARLFLGIAEGHGPQPPYASLWRSGEMLGAVTASIARAFADAGATPLRTAGPCDHIADLLAFMSWLAALETPDAPPDVVQRQRRFLDDHLLSWVPAWAAAIEAAAEQSFYRVWARLLTDFLRADAEFLGDMT